MKRVLAIFLAAALCALTFAPHAAQGQDNRQGKLRRVPGAIPNSYIVVLKRDVPGASVAAVANSLARSHAGRVGFIYEHALKGFSVELPEAAAIALSNNPVVEFVEEDGVGSIVNAQISPPWGLDRIDQRSLPLTNSYLYSRDGSGVHAYVIDTGILASHVEFGGRAAMAADFVGEGCADCNGHGTHVAGTIGSASYGVAKGVTLRAVKVCDMNGLCSSSATIAGVNFVTQQKQNNPTVPAVANMSLRFLPPVLALDNAVRNSINAGVTYAVGAGNDMRPAADVSPARVLEAITVAATDSADTHSWFTNYGSAVDLYAPGENVLSTWNTSNTATNTASGTSMAAPHVAGVAALFLQENPSASPATVQQTLVAHATPNKVINSSFGTPNLLLYSLFRSERDNRADFDRDYKTDVSVWDQSSGVWTSHNISNGQSISFGFGQSGDIITPGDYNADGRTDYAMFRPSNGTWYVATDTSGSFYGVPFGQSGDIPVARDYDGDGKTDHAVFRPSNATWYILNSNNSTVTFAQLGLGTDRPVPGDYDGDGRANIAVFRPSNGTWYVLRLDGSFYAVTFGGSTDLTVQADYDGDDLTDIAIFRPSTGQWWIINSSTNTAQVVNWGQSGDVPVPGDYDGDGRADVAVQRPGNNAWYILNSSTNNFSVIGFSAGLPVPTGYLN